MITWSWPSPANCGSTVLLLPPPFAPKNPPPFFFRRGSFFFPLCNLGPGEWATAETRWGKEVEQGVFGFVLNFSDKTKACGGYNPIHNWWRGPSWKTLGSSYKSANFSFICSWMLCEFSKLHVGNFTCCVGVWCTDPCGRMSCLGAMFHTKSEEGGKIMIEDGD